ncbi:MAG: sigma-54-dependent Fis family transcriptional regulator [Rhodoferax sp.]|nr:sigma-54-dependent Fis family transcriptional regulator [Rhodoferax sp.]
MTARSTQHIDNVISRTSLSAGASAVLGDDPILRSWRRCVTDHGLDPTRAQAARVLEAWQVREHQEQIESFMRVARAGMEQLYKRVSPLGYVLLLTDAQGITVDCIGNDQWDRELRRSGLCLGADWNESRAGTCGVGTCIVEQAPLTCHQEDHFDATHIGLTCTTAPLFDPTGEFIGVLDISALTSPSEKPSQHLARHMTVMYAKMVEDANFMRHFADRWILRLDVDWALVEVSGECLLAFDVDGIVVGANTGARRLLAASRQDPSLRSLVGNDLPSIFKVDMAEVWRMSRIGTTSERTVLSTHLHELFYAMVSPPRRFGSRLVRGLASTSAATDFPALDHLAGEDAQMQRLIDQAKRLVNKKVNILLHGETGTGKELVARALHESSQRARQGFVAVNCASIPESLIESELFGHTTGSFTGARSKGARGLIQQSSGGTLFLDEIGDMPLPLQTRLLRVLSGGEVMPLGAEKPVPVDLTVVAASHRDLRRLIADGVFREDLYYRLCGATLHLPALRQRSDKAYVIARVLQQEAQQAGVSARLSGAAANYLTAYTWPGNIRQLRNVLRYALALCDDGLIEVADLPQEVLAEEHVFAAVGQETPAVHALTAVPAPHSAARSATQAETPQAQQLLTTLRQHHWNVTAVARELGICRATVYRQMQRYQIVSPTQL